MNPPPGQLALPFGHVASFGPDFLASESNAAALAWLDRTDSWPQHRLALWGPPGSGKTHLLHLWRSRFGGTLLSGRDLRAEPIDGALALDDADHARPEPLLHVLNAAAEARNPVLMASRLAPARWPARLPDLVSRLRALTAVELGNPEDSLLRALLMRLLAERQLAVPAALQDFMLTRLPRTARAIRMAAERLDEACLGGKPTRALAAAIVAAVAADDAAAEAGKDETNNEDFAAEARPGSHGDTPVL